ncbi:MAG: hypothetical protein E4H19_11830 [Chromatiales bacterium]|nr:MAG: hypothetical protein E4H19_11830 [Chromatiales bacterium]
MAKNNFIWILAATLALLSSGEHAAAEPYLAVQKGMQCSNCHSSPAGGGKRTVYGNVFAQSELAARRLGDGKAWTGEVTKWLAIGADLRASFEDIDVPNRSGTSDVDFNRGTFYAEATLIPNRLSLYVDEQFSPNDFDTREIYVRLNSKDAKWFVAGGEFYLPYGLRLQDDTAFVRQATGINFANTDRGLLGGYNFGPWSTIASITDGSGAGRDGAGNQVSLISSYTQATWRAGVSVNVNDDDAGDRTMFGLFGGLKTGPFAWLAEIDSISDNVSPGVTADAFAGLLEANWTIRGKNNLKLSYDYLDPNIDISEDQQVRYSLVWEHSPMQFIQARIGYRLYDGIPQVDAQNRKVFFAELHGFF